MYLAYDGNICKNDADGCDAISCLAEQPCTDNPAPAAGAVCDCPDGYKEINSKCVGEARYLVYSGIYVSR